MHPKTFTVKPIWLWTISSVGYGSDTKTPFPDMNDSIAVCLLIFHSIFSDTSSTATSIFYIHIYSITPPLGQVLCLPPSEQTLYCQFARLILRSKLGLDS